ncbi:MAG: hypothetical protein ACKOBH_02050 [bacterium]
MVGIERVLHRPGNRLIWFVAVCSTVLGFCSIISAGAAEAKKPLPCNGSPKLCGRSLDRVVLVGTHNSMSASQAGFGLPNQTFAIPDQLKRGARAFLLDTHYGRPAPNVLNPNGVDSVEDPSAFADTSTYLCHVLCQFGATKLTSGLRYFTNFLRRHPREVVVLINEDYIAPDDFATAVRASGLSRYVYTGGTSRWPTLGSMIRSGRRVVVFAQSDVGDISWYHLAYSGLMRETDWSFELPSELLDPESLSSSCAARRGGDGGNLFLMNHWISRDVFPPIPSIEDAALVNTHSALVARARACRTVRGRLPNILAVDFLGTGDAIGAARELNGL